MAITGPKLRSMYEDLVWFFDVWNIIGFSIICAAVVVPFVVGGFTPQTVLVAVTALYVFFTFNQMRESKFNPRPAEPLAVRPQFQYSTNSGKACDFGLKNFGKGPALNLRLKAILREDDTSIDSLCFSSRARHFHFEESSFLSLVNENSENELFEELVDSEASVFENYEQKSIELYYTFESIDGTEYPLGWSNPTEMDMDELVENVEEPRRIELAEVYEKCT